MHPKNARSAGFTLIEMMIVVAAIGILAAIGVPSYSSYIKESKLSEVPAIVATAKGKAEQNFVPGPANGYTSIGTACASASPSSYWSVSCEGNATTYNVVVAGTGDMDGFDFTETMAGARSTTIAAPAPSAWHASGSCFILKKGQGC